MVSNKNKLHRLTFSQSLATFISEKYPEYQVKRFNFKIGKKLEHGEKSTSGLYAIVSAKGGYALRISLIKEIAEMLCDNDTRYLAEAWMV